MNGNGHNISEPPEDFRHAHRASRRLDGGSRGATSPTDADRLPPHAPEAEQGVIGSCLMDESGATLAQCRRTIADAGEHFYVLAHRTVWVALCGLADAGAPISAVSVLQRLRDFGNLQNAGGPGMVGECIQASVGPSMWSHYLDIVRKKYIARRLMGQCTETIATLFEFEGSIEPMLGQLETEVETLQRECQDPAERGRRLKRPVDFMDEYWDHWFGRLKQEPGLRLPASAFGEFPFRVRTREMTFVLGEKGAGKTNLMFYLALHLAQQGMKVALAAMEEHPANSLKILASQLLGTRVLPDNPYGHALAKQAFEWLQARVRLYDFLGIAPWRELLAELEIAAGEGFDLFLVDSVMRLGIADDDYAEQGKCASHLARFTMESNAHLFLVNHLNKSDKSRGSQQWIDNAHNRLAIRRNEKRAGCLHELLSQRDAGELSHERFAEEVKRLNDHKETRWSSRFELLNQRWPGSQQNASRELLFNRDSLQLYDHRWPDAAVNWLERWRR